MGKEIGKYCLNLFMPLESTQLEYLNNSSLFISEAVILEIKETDGVVAVALDKTIFYPQGGGQPCDTGKIYNEHGGFVVSSVRLDQDGIVWHFGNFISGKFISEEKVTLEIEAAKRNLYTKLHSAGHLIDCAVEKLAIPNLQPTKGYHFPDGPSVEYQGTVENPEDLVSQLQKTIDELLVKNLPLEIHDLSPEEAQAKGIYAPLGKKARTVNFQGFSICGCGGTHVISSGQLGKILIKKIKSKKGITKIYYEVASV